MIKDYLKMAVKNLVRRKLRSWLTLLGIFIGIASVVSLISLGAGLKLAVANQFNILGAERITIQAKGNFGGPPGANVANPLTKSELEVVQRVRGVDVAGGRLIETTVFEYDGAIYQTFVGSVPKNDKEADWLYEVGNLDIQRGRYLNPSDKYKITIGSKYWQDENGLKLKLGDQIEFKGIPFEVVGLHEKKGAFTTDGIIAMNENVVREVFGDEDKFSIIVAKAANLDEMDLVVDRIVNALRKYRNLDEGREDFEVSTNVQSLESISDTLDIVTILLSGIAGISLIVGGIGIMNTMYTSVLERKSDIGIMKAIGARNKDIFIMFFMESGILGLVGGVVGVLIGVGIGKLVEIIGSAALGSNLLKASFTLELIFGALLFSFIVGALAGTLPAIGAAKQNPVDALRD